LNLPKKKQHHPLRLWACVSLLFLLLLTRSIALTAFPPFIDEALHIQMVGGDYGNRATAYLSESRALTVWWYTLFQPNRAGTFWLVRTVTLLAVLPGFAACLAIGRQQAGRWGLLFAAVFYLCNTYLLFFERLALGDPIAASLVSLGLYFAYRLANRINLWDAAFAGLILALSVVAKGNTLPYLGIPLAAAITLRAPDWRLGRVVRWLAVALGIEALLMAVAVVVWHLLGSSFFSLVTLRTQHLEVSLIERVWHNISTTMNIGVAYWGVAGLVFLSLMLIALCIQRQFFWVLCWFGPICVLWVYQDYFSRYYINAFALFGLCGALAFATLVQRLPQRVRWAVVGVVVGYCLYMWLPFSITAYTAPDSMALSTPDENEYIRSDASGFGLRETITYLHDKPVTKVIGLLSNCQGLRWLALHQLSIECPKINPDGSQVNALANDVAANQQIGNYVLLENNPYVPHTVPGKPVFSVSRPQNGLQMTLFALAP
jgi:hypothetical protein